MLTYNPAQALGVERRHPGEPEMLRYRDLLLAAPAESLPSTAMNSLRKWLYRPRRDDKSLLAKFW